MPWSRLTVVGRLVPTCFFPSRRTRGPQLRSDGKIRSVVTASTTATVAMQPRSPCGYNAHLTSPSSIECWVSLLVGLASTSCCDRGLDPLDRNNRNCNRAMQIMQPAITS
ncbi:hypothetical protein J6590_025983 [Homalodisca vitripennis]|nr:hypothetical protein J6590_025983 [Homalodisca vitripennis]